MEREGMGMEMGDGRERLTLEMFLRDAKQAEVMLSQQENYLAKDEVLLHFIVLLSSMMLYRMMNM